MFIRCGKSAETIETLIADLENGTRTLTAAQTALILRQMSEALTAAQIPSTKS